MEISVNANGRLLFYDSNKVINNTHIQLPFFSLFQKLSFLLDMLTPSYAWKRIEFVNKPSIFMMEARFVCQWFPPAVKYKKDVHNVYRGPLLNIL